ncbi:MAG: hypothetical protein QOI66_3919, partial [Myxococcales bacterium]|nr:hypothetical protein [Myxococcales bacterium]
NPPLPTTTVLTPGGPTVTVALAAVALAGDCGISAGTSDTGTALRGGSCALGSPNCGCQQSNVQLKVSAGGGTGDVTFEIVRVRVLDHTSGKQLDQLTARSPQKWSGTTYSVWDQKIAPLDDFTASYQTSAPNWTSLSPNGFTNTTYRVEVDLLIGGQPHTVSLDGVTRETPIST